jgi:hypothetical protein
VLRATYRHVRLLVVIVAIAIATFLVTAVTIDLGPSLKELAEREGSKFIDRPMHIGQLSVRIFRGQFVIEDLRIEGLTPEARPWLVAKQIDVSLAWKALWQREVLLDNIQMADWTMVVESFPDGKHNWPRLGGPPRAPRTGPRVVVTTMQYVRATRGAFIFEDHAARWRVHAPNVEVTAGKLTEYAGRAQFHGGTVHFFDFEPMSASMRTTFRVEDGKIVLDDTQLVTDGAVSELKGVIDAARWPEMTYQVKSTVQFPRMREIFFGKETFSLHGEGEFTGTFHLFRGGRELKGRFASRQAGLNDYRFQNLEGGVDWLPTRFEVIQASSEFYGGRTRFNYLMSGLGQRPGPGQTPGHARFDVQYDGVDLTRFTDFLQTRGLRLAGRASGTNVLEWQLGAFRDRQGRGVIGVAAPGDVLPMTREVTPELVAAAEARSEIQERFSNHTPLRPVPLSGTMSYSYAADTVTIAAAQLATQETFVTVNGTTTFGGQNSRLPFHVSSSNWQESDRLLAGLMTAFGAPTSAIELDGAGEFDGVMLGTFRRPRIEGRFRGRAMQAFDVVWGDAEGDVVVENAYASVRNAVITRDGARMEVSGLFSLGFPRRDGGEEINARIRLDQRPVADLLDAFDLESYPVDGRLSGEFHLYGPYTRPYGFGRMTIDDGTAYKERFSTASAGLRFEGNGVRLDAVAITKGEGTVTGAAYVGWNGTYSFTAEGRGLAVESLRLTSFSQLPALTGVTNFTAGGSGTFGEPQFDVRVDVQDLFFGEEGIGEVTGRLSVRDALLTYELEAASTRLAASGTGRMTLGDGNVDLTFRVTDAALDPYVRVFKPDFSPYTTAVGSGTIRVTGDLYTTGSLKVSAAIEQLDLRVVDYRLRNQGPIQLAMDSQTLHLETLRLVGEDTALDVTGSIDLPRQALSLQAYGAANLAVLQGFLRNVRSSGRADVSALIGGTAQRPMVSGQALLTQGRLRHFSFPHALEDLNGVVTFNAAGIRLDDPGYTSGLTGKLGGGTVKFAGRIGINGYELSEFDLIAAGTEMRLRFPEGMRSVVNATLALQGPPTSPLLSGTVTVQNAAWTSGFDSTAGMFSLSDDASGLPVSSGGVPGAPSVPLRYDVRIVAPSTLRIENSQAQIVASTELNLRGTFDRPLLFGRADIDRGDVRFEGRRYQVTRGSLDFTNPNRIQPFFDIEAETRVRVPQQTYRVTLRLTGTTDRMQPTFESDPPLAPIDVLTLLFSDSALSGDIELASLRQPNQREQEILQARATRALTGVLSDEVGRVVQDTFGVDTFQITPMLTDPYLQSSSRLNVNPAARVTIGKRISDRVYLTYARSLSSSRFDELILLEYDQTDRLGWVLSQNEDRTYALEVRKRHLF